MVCPFAVLAQRSGKLETGCDSLGVGILRHQKLSGEVLPGYWKSHEIQDMETLRGRRKKKGGGSFGGILMKHIDDFALNLEY